MKSAHDWLGDDAPNDDIDVLRAVQMDVVQSGMRAICSICRDRPGTLVRVSGGWAHSPESGVGPETWCPAGPLADLWKVV